MRKNWAKSIACLAVLIAGAPLCFSVNHSGETFRYGPKGVADVKIGVDYTSVPYACDGLYSRSEFRVCCGSEDGEGVEIMYYDDNSDDFIISAMLNVEQSAMEKIYEKGLECNDYPITDSIIANLLRQTQSATIEAVTVAPSPSITVDIDGQEIATTAPARKFMEMPGAVTTVNLGEGLFVTCTIGGLTMTIMNAYEAVSPEALSVIGKKYASAMETGMFEPITVSPADVNPDARFDFFSYY